MTPTPQTEQWCDDNGKPHSELLEARLAPDMFSLPSQIRLSARWAHNGVLLNEGYHFKSSDTKPDVENSFAELQRILQETLEFLESVKAEDIDASKPLSIWSSGTSCWSHLSPFTMGHMR